MLTIPLWYNFPPLSMRITNWIVKKKSTHAEKIFRKKVELQATFIVRIVHSLINLWFLANQIEETGKQTKLRWRVVDHSHIWQYYQYRKQFRTVYYAFYQLLQQQQQVMQQPQQYYINENQRFRWDQSHRKFVYQWQKATFWNCYIEWINYKIKSTLILLVTINLFCKPRSKICYLMYLQFWFYLDLLVFVFWICTHCDGNY